jgi:hypothetical protein
MSRAWSRPTIPVGQMRATRRSKSRSGPQDIGDLPRITASPSDGVVITPRTTHRLTVASSTTHRQPVRPTRPSPGRSRTAPTRSCCTALEKSSDNDLLGSELNIGADTALNNIVEGVDKIKQSEEAAHRHFVTEMMGRYCGDLAMMRRPATGAERVNLHEDGGTGQAHCPPRSGGAQTTLSGLPCLRTIPYNHSVTRFAN